MQQGHVVAEYRHPAHGTRVFFRAVDLCGVGDDSRRSDKRYPRTLFEALYSTGNLCVWYVHCEQFP
jgi:hypothetical protein